MVAAGNEAGYGRNQDAQAAYTRQRDPSRPLHYESCGGGTATDIICPMYPSPAKLKGLTTLSGQNERSLEFGKKWQQVGFMRASKARGEQSVDDGLGGRIRYRKLRQGFRGLIGCPVAGHGDGVAARDHVRVRACHGEFDG